MARSAEEVIAIGFDYRDHVLTLACPRCPTAHEVRLQTTMMVTEPVCPECGYTDRLEPAAVSEAFTRLAPKPPWERCQEINAAVDLMVRTWSTLPEVRALLDYDGHDVSAGMALRLVPLVLRGLLHAEWRQQ